jgi:hypothetical protein
MWSARQVIVIGRQVMWELSSRKVARMRCGTNRTLPPNGLEGGKGQASR